MRIRQRIRFKDQPIAVILDQVYEALIQYAGRIKPPDDVSLFRFECKRAVARQMGE